MNTGTRADRGETDFANTLSAGQPTTIKIKKKAIRYEEQNEYESHHPFKPRLGPGPGHLDASPIAIRRTGGGKMMMGDKMMADSTNAATLGDMPQKQPMTEAEMMAACQKMKEQKQKMKEDMMAQGSQLTEQIAEMNRAPAAQKLDLMAAVLTRMEEQKITMDARKAKMEEAMMQHMMQQMQMGKDSMAQCPMMKGMKGMGEKTGDAQEE